MNASDSARLPASGRHYPARTKKAALRPPSSASLALDVLHQAPLGLDLPLGEDVLLALVRVGTLAEDEAHRGADQLEALAEEVLQVGGFAPAGCT
ncbi:hypothetical protein G6F63_016640 [Rhizopus arrhizus]|nr:hypothetical protein G6F63_016640 [Rhizopus arrhizus]